VNRLRWVTIDTSDPRELAAFWQKVLDVGVEEETGESSAGPRCVMLHPAGSEQSSLVFQWVSERKAAKNRLHVDVEVDDLEVATELVESLGGSRAPEGDYDEPDFRWRVMLDPHGNEFCLIPSGQ
jgi:predicted enzyme related to lactoylglutathione lyase